jgi:hypothetical protein
MNLSALESLLYVLNAIETSDLPSPNESVYLHTVVNDHPQYKDLIDKALTYADEALILDNGQCNWESITYLKEEGYTVVAGEQDRWGWLTGCIQTTKGRLVYG